MLTLLNTLGKQYNTHISNIFALIFTGPLISEGETYILVATLID